MKQQWGFALFLGVVFGVSRSRAQHPFSMDSGQSKRSSSANESEENRKNDFIICNAYTFQVQKRLERLDRHVKLTRRANSGNEFFKHLYNPHSLSKGAIPILKLNEYGEYELFNPQHQTALNIYILVELHNTRLQDVETSDLLELATLAQNLKTLDQKVGEMSVDVQMSSKEKNLAISKVKARSETIQAQIQSLRHSANENSFVMEDFDSMCSRSWIQNISFEQSLALVELYSDKIGR